MVRPGQDDRRGQVTTHRPRRIVIQYDATTQSATDGSITPWSTPQTLCGCWTVDWRTGSGRVTWMADEPRADDDAVIRVRWRSDVTITPKHRIAYTSAAGATRYYDINAVIDVGEQHQYWDLYVKAKAV